MKRALQNRVTGKYVEHVRHSAKTGALEIVSWTSDINNTWVSEMPTKPTPQDSNYEEKLKKFRAREQELNALLGEGMEWVWLENHE